jgi:Ca-activated chloride channel homolog
MIKPAHSFTAITILAMVLIAVAQEPPSQTESQPQATSGPPVSTIKVPPPPPDPDAFRVSSNVELVLLDVSVKDADGGFVSNLKQSDFTVYEDKVEQKITAFSAKDVPVTVGLVVDNSGSVRPKKPEVVTAALTFVKKSNPQDEIFIVNFNDRVRMGLPPELPFTGDASILRQALLSTQAQGRTALYDGLKQGLEHLKQGRLAKKTLVLISDGGDNSSDLTRDEIIQQAESSLATIYTVGIWDAQDKDRDPRFLRQLARITGGESFIPQNADHLVGICEKIAFDIRNRYTIGFVPSNRSLDGKIRKLRLMAQAPAGKKYEVRTRTHYVAASNVSSSRSREGNQ